MGLKKLIKRILKLEVKCEELSQQNQKVEKISKTEKMWKKHGVKFRIPLNLHMCVEVTGLRNKKFALKSGFLSRFNCEFLEQEQADDLYLRYISSMFGKLEKIVRVDENDREVLYLDEVATAIDIPFVTLVRDMRRLVVHELVKMKKSNVPTIYRFTDTDGFKKRKKGEIFRPGATRQALYDVLAEGKYFKKSGFFHPDSIKIELVEVEYEKENTVDDAVVKAYDMFESIKHYDDDGKEYWLAHELCKLMGYAEYRNFEPAIKRAEDFFETKGIDPRDCLVVNHETVPGGGGGHGSTKQSTKTVPGYKMSRYGCYVVSMQCNPAGKPNVVLAQEYFIMNTLNVEEYIRRVHDRKLLDGRREIAAQNKIVNGTILSHGVSTAHLPIALSIGDEGMFGMPTSELKAQKGIPDNRPVADFMAPVVSSGKKFAQELTATEIEFGNLHGLSEISNCIYDNNSKIRGVIFDTLGKNPEDLMTMEDVKEVKKKYETETKEHLKELEEGTPPEESSEEIMNVDSSKDV